MILDTLKKFFSSSKKETEQKEMWRKLQGKSDIESVEGLIDSLVHGTSSDHNREQFMQDFIAAKVRESNAQHKKENP